MERSKVYELIDGERAYQQAQGHPDNAAKPIRWLDAIQYYTDKAWSNTHEDEVMSNIRKIAALAVAAMEQYGCPPREPLAQQDSQEGVQGGQPAIDARMDS